MSVVAHATHRVERRQFGRRTTFLHGMIHVRGRPPAVCIVRDLSSGGAKIETHMLWLPSRFHLVVEAIALRAECEIVHHTGAIAGVRFARRQCPSSADAL